MGGRFVGVPLFGYTCGFPLACQEDKDYFSELKGGHYVSF